MNAAVLVPPPGFLTQILHHHYDDAVIGTDPEFGYFQSIFCNKTLFDPIVFVWDAAVAYVKADGNYPFPNDIKQITIDAKENVVLQMGSDERLHTSLSGLMLPNSEVPPREKGAARTSTAEVAWEDLLPDQPD